MKVHVELSPPRLRVLNFETLKRFSYFNIIRIYNFQI